MASEGKHSAHHARLEAELDKLEREDPAVRRAARTYEQGMRRIIEGRAHRLPCTNSDCEWHHPQ